MIISRLTVLYRTYSNNLQADRPRTSPWDRSRALLDRAMMMLMMYIAEGGASWPLDRLARRPRPA